MTIINGIEVEFKTTKIKENEIKKAIILNEKIEDSLHVVIVLSNPAEYARRYILTKEFIERMKYEQNIILYVVELAYGNQNFYITNKNNPRHLQLRSDYPLWHKENLINIGIQRLLPENWKAVAWIDSDIEFDNPDWANTTLKILNGSKDIVQLFSQVMLMDLNEYTTNIYSGYGFQYAKQHKKTGKSKIHSYWHPGYAWACTRKFYDLAGGLFEYAIIGGGDLQLSACLLSRLTDLANQTPSEDYKEMLIKYESKVAGCTIGYVPVVIRHYYHGSIDNRRYLERQQLLYEHNFSPTLHLTKDGNGLLIPTSSFPQDLLFEICEYFNSRCEDDGIKKLPIKPIYMFDRMNCIIVGSLNDEIKNELLKISIINDTFNVTTHDEAINYAYKNKNEYLYTLVIENCVKITDTNRIMQSIKEIEDDWDIVCFGANPVKNIDKCYYSTYSHYKFKCSFSEAKFYIIKNSLLNMFIQNNNTNFGEMYQTFNIYNVNRCIYCI